MAGYYDVDEDIDLEDAFLLASAPHSRDENDGQDGRGRAGERRASLRWNDSRSRWEWQARTDDSDVGPDDSLLLASPPPSSDDGEDAHERTKGAEHVSAPVPVPARRRDIVDTAPWWDSQPWRRFLRLSFPGNNDNNNNYTGHRVAAHFPPTTTLHDVENMAGTKNRPPSLESIVIGLDVSSASPDMRSPSQASRSADSDLVGRIIDSYLTPRTPSGGEETERVRPAVYQSTAGSTEAAGTRGSEIRNRRNTDVDQEPARTESAAPGQSRRDTGQPVAETPLRRTINDMVAVRRLAGRRTERETESVGAPGEAMEGTNLDVGRLMRELERIATHNESRPSAANEPEVLSDSAVARVWVQERLQETWERTYKPALAERLARPGAEHVDEGTQEAGPADGARTREPGTQLSRRRRSMTREAMIDCMRSQVAEVESGLLGTLLEPLRELEELHLFKAAQRYMLLRSFLTTHEVLSSVLAQHDEMVGKSCSTEIPLVVTKLSALSGVLELSLNACSQLETRVNRLSAKDVPAGDERDAVSQGRLAQPDALTYLDRATQDVQLIRDNVRAVLAGIADVETDLNGIARGCTRLLGGYDDAMAFVVEDLSDDP